VGTTGRFIEPWTSECKGRLPPNPARILHYIPPLGPGGREDSPSPGPSFFRFGGCPCHCKIWLTVQSPVLSPQFAILGCRAIGLVGQRPLIKAGFPRRKTDPAIGCRKREPTSPCDCASSYPQCGTITPLGECDWGSGTWDCGQGGGSVWFGFWWVTTSCV
jgi:hypothetical protein